MGSKGIVASTASLGVLLQEGIGDTIRISLTPEPEGDRCNEVIVAQEILQTMGLRSFTPLVTACPGCGRTTSTVFQELAEKIQTYVRSQMPIWRPRATASGPMRGSRKTNDTVLLKPLPRASAKHFQQRGCALPMVSVRLSFPQIHRRIRRS